MTYMPQDWTEKQRIHARRAIADLENQCQNLSEEEKQQVYNIINRFKLALQGDTVTIEK
jgi:hypothetical protein